MNTVVFVRNNGYVPVVMEGNIAHVGHVTAYRTINDAVSVGLLMQSTIERHKKPFCEVVELWNKNKL